MFKKLLFLKKFLVIKKIISFWQWIFSSKDLATAEKRFKHEINESEKEVKDDFSK